MTIPRSVIEEISHKTSMVDIVGEYTTLKFTGGSHTGLCPFHSERTPSFSVNEDKKLFYCFGCHKGGDLFQFLMEIENLNFVEAVKLLGEKSGVEIPEEQGGSKEESLTPLYELYTRVSNSFRYLLTGNPAGKTALEYLKRRGFSDETIAGFNLGYAPSDPNWLHDFLTKKGYTHDFLARSGLFTRRDTRYPLFRNRLMIPIESNQGRVVAFGARLLEGDGPKYLNSPETPIFKKSRTLFGLNKAAKSIRKEGVFHLCEGYMDVMALSQGGVQTSVAPLGTSFTRDQASLLKRYADRGNLLFDIDAAGQNAAVKAVTLCAEAGIETSVIKPEGGKDPAEILEKEGEKALQNLLKYHINSFDYLVEMAMKEYDAITPEGKHRILRYLSPFIEVQDSAVKRDGYLRRLSEVLEVNVTAITADLSQNTSSTQKVQRDLKDPEKIDSGLFLMLGAAAFPEHFPAIRQYIRSDDLDDRRARQLFIILEEAFRRDELEMNNILQKVDNEDIRALIFEKAFSGEFGDNPADVIHDVVRRLRRTSLNKRQKEVARALGQAESRGTAPERLKELLSEKMYLTEELQKLRVKQE